MRKIAHEADIKAVSNTVVDSLTKLDMWALGITIVMGGQYFAWNAALSVGTGGALLATLIVTSGYVCLILCIAELSSGLPFAGIFLVSVKVKIIKVLIASKVAITV